MVAKTIDPQGGVGVLPPAKVPMEIGARTDQDKLVSILSGYLDEADNNRKAGLNPRDTKWTENLDLYWNRVDFSKKADWQAKETMPEVPTYVDRFAAALKEAIVATPEGFYTVVDPADKDGDMSHNIKKLTDQWLSICGRNQVGQLLPFPAVFEEQMKLGAIMACAQVVTWKNDVPNGRVAIESLDPRFVWLDHTYRNLYRIRRTEIDRHELGTMVKAKDSKGKPIFNLNEIERMVGQFSQSMADEAYKQELSGSGTQISSSRKPIQLDEYIATVVDEQGNVLADRALIVLADGKYVVRGPERNPFWHGKDWMLYTPLVTAPLSVYGRSYMEDFGSVASTFTTLTNMILDAVHTSSLRAFAVVPAMLANPGQLAEGISPNKMFMLEDGYKAEDFAKALELGTLPPEAVAVWKAMKSELSEAASLNEIGIGQFAPHARTSATEVTGTQQNSSALIRSVAQTVETRHLDPTLDLVWKTGLQHASPNDPALAAAVGQDMYDALIANRKELIKRPITFQSRGISSLIQRSQMFKSLIGLMSVIASNPNLLQEFMKEISVEKLVKRIFELANVDLSSIKMTEREKMMAQFTGPLNEAQAQAQNAPPNKGGGNQGKPAVQDLVRSMGIGQGQGG